MKTLPPTTNRSPFHRALRYAMIASGLCLAPFVALALVAISYLGLHRDAATLRKEIFATTPVRWSTKLQFNLGESTLGAAELAMGFVRDEKLAQARELLAAVKRASVGVYERKTTGDDWSRTELLTKTDRAMEKRGWARLVGVVDHESTVMVYGPRDRAKEHSIEVCLAVINHKELVIASAKLDGEALDELIEKQGWESLHSKTPFFALTRAFQKIDGRFYHQSS